MIKYLDSNINKWYNDDSELIKVYYHGAICYYKVDSSSPSGQTPCFAVVADITQYSDTEFEDVFNQADGKWYKLNNLNQYEEYGVYGSGRTSCEGSTSRLPQGYTEVEYISSEDISESVLGPYIDTNYKPTQNTRFVIEYQSTTNTRDFQRIFGSGEFDMLGYLVNIEGKISTSGYYYYKFGQTSSWYTTNVQCDLNRHIIDYNNSKQFLLDNVSIATLPNNSFTCSDNLGIFWSINTKYTTNNINFIGRIFSAKLYEDGILVRDFVPCISPNNVVGMYDIVNNVFYTSSNNYSFKAGEPIAPTECVTTYEGKLTIDEEIIPSPSRLPSGYTEVEYIERNASHNGYVGLGEYFQTNTRIQIDFQMTQAKGNAIIGDYGSNDSDDWRVFLNYDSQVNNWLVYDFTNSRNYYNTGDWSKRFNIEIGNYYIKDLDSGNYLINTTAKTSFSRPNQMYLFHMDGTQSTNNIDYGRIYSLKIWQNDVLVKEFVPCQRDSDNAVGLYDIVNDEFHNSSGGTMVAGSAVTPPSTTATCEFMYSGDSWVNVGEVSGSTIDTIWIDPPSTNNQNASFDIGHYWGEGYKMVMNAYLSGSYSSDVGSFWQYNEHTPIEFNFYANGFYYDFHNPTSTTAPNVYTGDYSWRIMKNNTLNSYENSQILNVILTNGIVRVELEDGTAIVTGSTSVTAQNWYNGLYQAKLGTMNTSNKCHTSRIQIYNANNELVNDIKFIKNQGITGSQEISAYDSVLNVTYNNTNSYTPSYHVVTESGGTEYPVYYDEMQDPPNNLSFSSMTEAEEYECPWVGMKATIDGDKYVFSGDSISGYEWVEQALPYEELQWIEMPQVSPYCAVQLASAYSNSTSLYYDFEILFNSLADTRIIGFASNSFLIGYINKKGTIYLNISGSRTFTVYDQFTTNTKYHFGLGKRNGSSNSTFDNLDASTTYATFTKSLPTTDKPYFGAINMGGTVYTTGESERIYSIKVYDNEVLVGNYIPVKRLSDNFVTLYDTVSEQFCDTVGGGTMVAGPTV